jgi:AcrR family transcriptional regulator
MGTKSRKQAEKESRRESILQAAEVIMTIGGLHSLSIDAVAQQAQLATGTIYLYFKNKEEILATLTVKARLQLLSAFEKVEQSDSTPLDKIKQIVQKNYLFYQENPLYYDLVSLYEANNTLVESDEMYKSSEKITHLVSRMIDEAKRAGTLNENIDIQNFTLCLWGMTTGILQLIKVRGNIIYEKMQIEPTHLLDTFLEILENGINKKL